jgi:hypothetical protein
MVIWGHPGFLQELKEKALSLTYRHKRAQRVFINKAEQVFVL